MTTLTMGRIMLALSTLACLALALCFALGYRYEATEPAFYQHLLAALAALIPAFGAQVWFAFFWMGTYRAARRALEGEVTAEALDVVRRNALVWAPGTFVLALAWVGTFFYGAWIFAEGASPILHHVVAWLVGLAHVFWIGTAWRRHQLGELAMDSLAQQAS